MARHNAKHNSRKKSPEPVKPKRSLKPADPAVTAQFVRKIQIFLQTTAR